MKRSATRSLLPLLTLLLAAALLAPAAASAGEDCSTSRVANSLLGCQHCQAMKKLLGDEAVSRLQLDVHDFPHGVLIEVHAARPSDRDYLDAFVREMWTRDDHADRQLSDACAARYAKLDRVHIESAPTEDGVFLILSSDEDELAQWLQDDARATRTYVLAAATN